MTADGHSEGEIIRSVQDFAIRRGLPANFFTQLLLDEDWAAIVKVSAVVETGLNEALAARMPPEWKESIIGLPLRTKRQMAVAANLLPEKIDRAIETLSGLRNAIVHDAKGLQFDLSRHLEEPGKLQSFVARVGWVMCSISQLETEKAPPQTAIDSVTENPKFACLMVALMTLLYLGEESPSTDRPA